MLATHIRRQPRRPVGFGQQIPLGDITLKSKWSFTTSNNIGMWMLICVISIAGLEITSLVMSTDKGYGTTASIGSGLWCDPSFLITAIFILIINCIRRLRIWTTITLVANIIAMCFSVILIGLDAKAVKDGVDVGKTIQYYYGTYRFLPKYKIIAAQLAFACVEFLLCLAFIITYIVAFAKASKHTRQQQQQTVIRPQQRPVIRRPLR